MKRTMKVQKVTYNFGGDSAEVKYFPLSATFTQIKKELESTFSRQVFINDITEATLNTSLTDEEWLAVATIKEEN